MMFLTVHRVFNPVLRSYVNFLLSILLVSLLSVLSNKAEAQRSLKEIKKTADTHFKDGEYRQALNYYIRYDQYKGGDPEIVKNLAISQYYSHQLDDAVLSFERLIHGTPSPDDAELYYYYALTLKHQYKFEQAADQFKRSLQLSNGRVPTREEIITHLQNCYVGMDINYAPPTGYIENLGSIVNSIGDDISPVYSKHVRDKIYFASNVDRHEAHPLHARKSLDIYSTELIGGTWSDPSRFPEAFCSSEDEVPLTLFNRGGVLFFQRGSMNGSRILMDTFSNHRAGSDIDFETTDAPVFPELGDRNAHNFGDSILLFSSLRPGGFGGYDLYYSIRKDNGWTAPTNFGPKINSAFNELDPFLSVKGNNLFFSSDRPDGLGGFDIFHSHIVIGTRNWDEPVNAGTAVNSAGNDRNVQLAGDGNSLVLSSDRLDGFGHYDLYIVYIDQSAASAGMKANRGLPEFIAGPEPIVLETDTRDIYEVVQDTTMRLVTEEELSVDTVADVDTFALIDTVEQFEAPPIVVVDEEIYPKKTIDIFSVYYSENDVVLNPQSIRGLDQITALLETYPKLRLQFYSHSSDYNGPIYFDLYFSAKRAEQVVNYLIEKGIDSKRLSIVGLGSQFPYAGLAINYDLAGFSTKLNRRIDMLIHGGEEYNLSFNYFDGGLEENQLDERHDQLAKLLHGISFKVRVKSVSQVYKDMVLSQFSFPMIESYAGKNTYHYSIGWTTSYLEAHRLRNYLRKRKYSDATVVPYYKGEKMSESQAKQLARTSPDLKAWLRKKQ